MSITRKSIAFGAALLLGAGLAALSLSTNSPAVHQQAAERPLASLQDGIESAAHPVAVSERKTIKPETREAATRVIPPLEKFSESRVRAIFDRCLPAEIFITQQELDKLVEAYLVAQRVRNVHEMSIAEVKLADGVLDVVIPNYATTGKSIEAMLQKKIAEILGPERATRVWQHVQEDMRVEFDMFGDSTQDLLATVSQAGTEKTVRIERTKNWSDNGIQKTATSVYVFDARQVEEGDELYLAPLLRQILRPKTS